MTTRTPCPKGKPDHFWLVEEALGPLSKAKCVYCKAERDDQKNSLEADIGHWRLEGSTPFGRKSA